jgi:hypothetical protein
MCVLTGALDTTTRCYLCACLCKYCCYLLPSDYTTIQSLDDNELAYFVSLYSQPQLASAGLLNLVPLRLSAVVKAANATAGCIAAAAVLTQHRAAGQR